MTISIGITLFLISSITGFWIVIDQNTKLDLSNSTSNIVINVSPTAINSYNITTPPLQTGKETITNPIVTTSAILTTTIPTQILHTSIAQSTVTKTPQKTVTATPTIHPTVIYTTVITTTIATTTPIPTPIYTYKNGSYTATGSYGTPEGNQNIGITLYISSDIITNITVTNEATNGTSQQYQASYAQAIGGLVKGKKVDANFNFSNVNGSSLTNQGFLDALSKIKITAHS